MRETLQLAPSGPGTGEEAFVPEPCNSGSHAEDPAALSALAAFRQHTHVCKTCPKPIESLHNVCQVFAAGQQCRFRKFVVGVRSSRQDADVLVSACLGQLDLISVVLALSILLVSSNAASNPLSSLAAYLDKSKGRNTPSRYELSCIALVLPSEKGCCHQCAVFFPLLACTDPEQHDVTSLTSESRQASVALSLQAGSRASCRPPAARSCHTVCTVSLLLSFDAGRRGASAVALTCSLLTTSRQQATHPAL